VVWAEEEQQRLRLMLRDHLSTGEAGQRLAAQMPLAEKRRRARFVVDNSGDPPSCRADAERVYRELARLARAAAKHPPPKGVS
jgi:dephospho-CoA kinase